MNDFIDTPGRDLAIGVDLGGTNFRVAAYRGLGYAAAAQARGDGEVDFESVGRHREEVGAVRDPDSIVERLVAAIRRLRAELGDDDIPVGIGFAGMFSSHDGFVSNSPHLGWRDVPFGLMLRRRLGDRVAVLNDVNAITLGEQALGAAAGAADVLAVFVGTGIGGGLIEGGRLVSGARGCAAEIGHCKVIWGPEARECACGKRGCVEAYAGGHNLQRRVRAELRGGARSLAVSLAGGADQVHPGHLDKAAERGDSYALDLYDEIAPLLGVAIANAVTLTNPTHVILGGGVLSRTPVLREEVVAALEVAVNPPALEGLTIADAALGDDAGPIGAALSALRLGASMKRRRG